MICDLCTDPKTSRVKTKDSSTTNLFSHLRVWHPAKHAEVAPISVPKSTPQSKPSKRQTDQPTLVETVERRTPYDESSDRYQLLIKSVTRYLTSGNSTFSL